MKPVRPIKSTIIATVVRSSLFFWIALVPGLFASGQVKFTTVVSSQDIGQKDYLQLEYVVENAKQIDELTPPNFSGFQVVQGPIQSSGMSIVNGAMSQYKGLSFVLQPVRTGKFTIGGASATVDGRPMRSNAVTINVHSGGGGSSGNGNGKGNSGMGGGNPFVQPFGTDPFGPAEPRDVDRDYILRPGENVKEKIRKNLFLKVQVDKNSCFVGEPIVATYKLYTRVSSESRITKRPSLNGFSVYDMVDPASDPVSVEKLNGKAYTVHIIRKTQLIPLQAGNINLDPVEVENTVHFVRGGGHQERHGGGSLQDLLDQMMDDNSYGPEVEENVTLDTKPVTIAVKPLPENKPAGFNGAVGNFSVETSLGNKTVAAQDEMTLHVVVRGKGNIPMITAPTVNWPTGFESFEPTAKEDVNKTTVPMSGSKSFDYVFTARDPGHYTIPAVSFSFFDPATQTYRSASGEPQEIQVTPAVRKGHPAPATGAVAVTVARQSLTDRVGEFIFDHLEWIFAVMLISGVAVYFWRQNLRLRKTRGAAKEEKADETSKADAEKPRVPVGANRGNAPIAPWEAAQAAERERQALEKAATPDTPGMASNSYVPEAPAVDPLQDARRLLEEGDPKGFYREVNRAIWKAIARKLNLPASELNKQNSIRQLQIRGWNESALLSLENILSECEMNLYTPAYDRYNMQQLLRQSEWMLDRLA
ncbi:MAG: protein BatD [Bacteroidetes bacterium]|nr:protein BatD [Bacteroidota bacterium]